MLGALMLGHTIRKCNRTMSRLGCDIFGKELPTSAIIVQAMVLPDPIFISGKLKLTLVRQFVNGLNTFLARVEDNC